MGQYRRHLAILLGAIVVICSTIIGVRWSRLAGRIELTDLDIPHASYAQEDNGSQAGGKADNKRSPAADDHRQSDIPRLLDLNTASVAELEALPGIGPVLAKNIVDYRRQHGPFRTVDELDLVKGIGDKKLKGIRDLVAVGVTPGR